MSLEEDENKILKDYVVLEVGLIKKFENEYTVHGHSIDASPLINGLDKMRGR